MYRCNNIIKRVVLIGDLLQSLRVCGRRLILEKRSGLEETINGGCHRLYGEERGYWGAENAYFGNKMQNSSYNSFVETVYLSERRENAAFLSYLYNALLPDVVENGGRGELSFLGERAAIALTLPEPERIEERAADAITEVLCIGYKYRFLEKHLCVSLSRRERRLLAAALIAADYRGDAAYVRQKVHALRSYALDGVYVFRLGALREKWEKIVHYIPTGFASEDLKKFCTFLAEESRNKIYLKGRSVYGADFSLLRRSRLMGEEDAETEIVLSDAGFIYCLGDVEDSLGDFLQKYYAERAIFS